MLHRYDIKELRQDSDIVKIVGAFVRLKKCDKLYRCKCPFHSDDIKSFVVYRELGRYSCLGCGAHGDVFTFLMTFKRLTFEDTVKYLNRRRSFWKKIKSLTKRLFTRNKPSGPSSEDTLEQLFQK